MKKDILKEFVAKNQDSFDEFEPGLDVLSKIQKQLGLEEKQESQQPKGKVVSFRYWWAAAAVVLLSIGALLWLQPHESQNDLVGINKPKKDTSSIVSNHIEDSTKTVPSIEKNIAKSPEKKKKNIVRKMENDILENNPATTNTDSSSQMLASNLSNTNDWRKDLQNTSSSSVRLATVLALSKQDDLSVSDMAILANTMNNDESSNVRLAALDALSKQQNQAEVKNLVLQSVAKQDDPIVQMELLSKLSPEEATSVKNKLLEITQNPLSIDAVRNQAYAALLRSKTNF